MSGKHGPKDPDVRAAFLAALEYGVSPLVDSGYEVEPTDRRRRLRPLTKRDRLRLFRKRNELLEGVRDR